MPAIPSVYMMHNKIMFKLENEDAKFLWVFLFMCFSTRIYSEQPFYLKILMVLFQLHVCLYSI